MHVVKSCAASAMFEPLESRTLLATTYTIADLGGGQSNTSFDAVGIVRISNSFSVGTGYPQQFGVGEGVSLKSITDLGTLLPPLKGGTESYAHSVSDGGVVAGTSYKGSTATAVQWVGGKPSSLGVGQANAISPNGKFIVGSKDIVLNNISATRAAIFGKTTKLLHPPPDGFSSHANDVNDSGFVVGQMDNEEGRPLPFFYDGKKTTFIKSTQENGEAWGINNKGIVVGELENEPFMYDTAKKKLTIMNPATVAGGIGSAFALDINSSNIIVGFTESGQGDVATVWEAGLPADLNKRIPSKSGWKLEMAKSINDKGQILVVGAFQGETHTALLIPNSSSVSNGTLRISGTPAADAVTVSLKGSKVNVTVNGGTQSFSKSGIKRISVTLGDGNDTITVGAGLAAVNATGGNGNDIFKVRNSVKDILDGGAGSDQAQVDKSDSLKLVETLLK